MYFVIVHALELSSTLSTENIIVIPTHKANLLSHWWSTACASLDCICIFLCVLICLYVCCWVRVSSNVRTDLCMVCQIGTRRTSPVICDWGNGEDTHPLNQQILQKIISCQILSDFCDCYLSVAKFHSVPIFINFFFDCHL